ncbi:MAG: hypothetical protein JWO88_3569 [Frankiales bacterium]|nr:hypothetical protein [Frankiales bacterium]
MPMLDRTNDRSTIESSIAWTSKAAGKLSARKRLQYFIAAGLTTESAAQSALKKIASRKLAAKRKDCKKEG